MPAGFVCEILPDFDVADKAADRGEYVFESWLFVVTIVNTKVESNTEALSNTPVLENLVLAVCVAGYCDAVC